MGEKNKFINSIKRAVKIMELYKDRGKYLGITEMSEALDLNKSTVYRIVTTLNSEGILVKNEDNQKYTLGYRVLNLARIMLDQYDFKDVVLEEMKSLRDEINETVILSIYSKQGGICLEKVEANNTIKITSQVGHISPLHAGATGKTLLAYAPEEEREQIVTGDLEKYTDNTVIEEDTLREQLEEIRETGYTVSRGELDEGALGIGAPILDEDGTLLYGLSVVGPINRMELYSLSELVKKVVAKSDEISEKVQLINSIKRNH